MLRAGALGTLFRPQRPLYLPGGTPPLLAMKKLLVGCGVLVLLFVLAGLAGVLMLPDTYSVERELVLNATPEATYDTIATLSTWPEWAVWNKEMDPTATWEFSGPASGDGAVWSWTGAEGGLGTGVLTLRDCARPASITYDLVMGGDWSSVGVFTISPAGEGVRVHWQNGGQLSGIYKLLGPFLDGMTGPMYETSLQGLKARLEAHGQ
ncbi:MAG: SRPBCC family protein [Planctomycetes bacterium]|nr:SRPBCC family protein [Planctomycetota bacterium]